MSRLLAILILAICIGGCARAARTATTPTVLTEFEQNPKPFIAHVAKLRGLPERRATRIVFHDEASFRAALEREMAATGGGADTGDSSAFFMAFGFSPPAGDNSVADVQREQVVAFYDDRAHVVHVRRPSTLSEEDRQSAALVLAHEIGHALQHDNFTVPPVRQIPDDDTFLASMALLEGDAMLVMLAYGSAEERVPLKRTLVRAEQSIRKGLLDEYLAAAADSKRLMAAPPLVRERLMFPYLGGMRFMGALHRAGGFALVDRAYGHPPVTTEQILHPEKYLAGENAIDVREPAAPSGAERLGTGRMGELQIKVTLERCNGRAVAERAAAGWGGDRYAIVRDGDGRIALLWSTAWDTEEDAADFEQAMQRTLGCSRQEGGIAGVVLRGESRVQRRGTHVAVVRGLDRPEAALAALLELPSAPVAGSPPFGNVVIPPIRQAPPTRPPYVAQGRYVNESLGIMAPIIPGYGVSIDEDGALTMSRDAPTPATGFVGISDWVVSPSSVGETFRRFAEGVQQAVDEVASAELVVVADPGRVQTPLGTAVERVWSVGQSGVRIRLLLLSICGGNGALLFAQLWADEPTKAQLDWWLGALRPLSADAPPICAELDP